MRARTDVPGVVSPADEKITSPATAALVAEIHANLERMARRWRPPQPLSDVRIRALDIELDLNWSPTTFPAFYRERERREREGEP